MELWFIYALISALLAGLFTFCLKIAAERNLDANVMTASYFLCTVVFTAVAWSYYAFDTTALSIGLLYGSVSGVLLASLYVIQIQGLRYIDTTIFYPIYKTLSPLFVIIASVLYIGEDLTQTEYIALAVSLLIPLLLISKSEHGRQRDLGRGVMILLICSLLAAVIVMFVVLALNAGVNMYLYLLVQTIAGLLTNVVIGYWRRTPIRFSSIRGDYLYYGLALGVLMFAANIFTFTAFVEGLVSIVYTVQSFYILVPIILSIIIYKEHINLQKSIAIALSILAIVFFQI